MTIEHVERLNKDLRAASRTLSDAEVRFLVDAYYQMQEARKRTGNQIGSMDKEPHELLAWFHEQNDFLEDQIKVSLDVYSLSKPIGQWMRGNYGIGPVIAAGLMAHIDIKKAPTVGHIWSFAGLDPTKKWEKKTKRPWNAALKTLCWKIGQSFMKFSAREDCYYGHVYRERKQYEIERNDTGGNAAKAAELLPKFAKQTEAYKHLSNGKLPPAQIDARSRRYAVKLFLAHMHEVWYEMENGCKPPLPYPIAHLGHAHKIEPPQSRKT